jgi:hypothetical protein
VTATDIQQMERIGRREASAPEADRAGGQGPAPGAGTPCTVRRTGPAGGAFACAGGGPELEVDAVEFCRTLSGRSAGDGLLGTRVVF